MARRDLEIRPDWTLPASELRFEGSRSSGPGGQRRDKVETRVTLWFDLRGSPSVPPELRDRLLRRLAPRLTRRGELRVQAGHHRERSRNEEEALQRLQALLRAALVDPRTRRGTRPTRASKERRLAEKRRRGALKRGRRGPSGEGAEGP